MISRVRVKILELFFSHVDELYYVREITRHTKEEINAVRRELDRMTANGLLQSEQRGNRLYYFLNKKYTFFNELQRMVAKTTGLGQKIRKNKRKLGQLDFVMFSGDFVSGRPSKHGQLDLLVVGDVLLAELTQLVKEHEKKMEREIAFTVFSKEEFEFRKTRRDPFVMDVLYGSRVMLIGSEEEFCERKIPGLN